MNEIINKVEKSSLIPINLDDFYPSGERLLVDIKDYLYKNSVLIEKDFRAFIQKHEWTRYQDKYVGVYCSSDAVIPLWAFMLLASKIQPFAKKVIMGNKIELEREIFNDVISTIDFSQFHNKNVILKGCGNHPIPESIFVEFMLKLQAFAKNVMFGEACSAVPLFKQKRSLKP